VGICREDNAVVVAVESRSDELASEIMNLWGGAAGEVAERYRLSAQKHRENATIA
jgi:hypothetical protein